VEDQVQDVVNQDQIQLLVQSRLLEAEVVVEAKDQVVMMVVQVLQEI
jgi:hypothetical protein